MYLLFRVLLLFLPFFFLGGIVLGNIEVLSPPSVPYVFFHESIYSEKGRVYIYIYIHIYIIHGLDEGTFLSRNTTVVTRTDSRGCWPDK